MADPDLELEEAVKQCEGDVAGAGPVYLTTRQRACLRRVLDALREAQEERNRMRAFLGDVSPKSEQAYERMTAELDDLRAKLAAAEKERDELARALRFEPPLEGGRHGRCEKDRGISETCTCGRDTLEAAAEVAREALRPAAPPEHQCAALINGRCATCGKQVEPPPSWAAPQGSRDERWRADQDACEADHESARRCDCPVPDCQHHRGLEPWPQESAPPPSGRAWELPRANHQFVRSTRGNWCGRRGDDGREWCGLSELSHPTPSAAASTVGVTVGIPAAGSKQPDHEFEAPSRYGYSGRCARCGRPREAHRRKP